MRTHTVSIDCPLCATEIEVAVSSYGQHYKATRDSPEEWPELYVESDLSCPSGCVWTALETIGLEQEAISKANDDMLEWLDEKDNNYDDEGMPDYADD